MSGNTNSKIKKLSVLAMMSAFAWLAMFFLKFPVVSFLKYEPKDIFIVLSGFLYGPLAAGAVALVTALLELPVSSTGVIGMVMNFLSSASFACIASFIYQRKKSLLGAILGLLSGMAFMTIAMLLWNYLITPLYMHIPRTEIVPMLTAVFLPFNLLKSGINAAVTMLLYRPFVQILQQAGMAPKTNEKEEKKSHLILAFLSCCVILGVCIWIVIRLNA